MTLPEQIAHGMLKTALESARHAQKILDLNGSDLTLEDCVSDLEFQFHAFTVNVQRVVDNKERKR